MAARKPSAHTVYRSPYPSAAVPTDLSLSQFLCTTNPDDAPPSKVILEEFDNPSRAVTYGGIRDAASRYAHALASHFHSGTPESRAPPLDLSASDNQTIPALMIFSSGTSGKPKGVVLSHYNLIAILLTLRATNPFTHNAHMREVFYPSFAHIYGMTCGVLVPAWLGSFVVAMKHYDFMGYVRRCARIRATVLRLVPATAIRMAKDPVVRGLGLASVKAVMCSGAALSADTVEELRGILDPAAAVLNGYGMSEVTVTLQRETAENKSGSIGKPAAGVVVRVVDDRGLDVPRGSEGEFLVSGPTVFMRYEGNPSETRAAFEGVWLKTGDVGKVDEDGFFWLTGRKKELIKYKGNQIAPAELEAVLLTHPLVVEAGVCGVHDKELGTEVPAGFVVLAENANKQRIGAELDLIVRHVHERVAPYKKLRGGLFAVGELPKGSTGKLLRRELPKLIAKSTLTSKL
ncbi:luciferin 4-monooxygenase [Xylariales sp. PMI_506]|nr:luciferin 4-monooxygenase [Xylariales sp. PMI_506]